MATYSSILAWRILGTGEPGRLQSIVLQRVGHDGSTLACVLEATEFKFSPFNGTLVT